MLVLLPVPCVPGSPTGVRTVHSTLRANTTSCHLPPLLLVFLFGHRCKQLLGQVSAELSHLNSYNVLEDCHHDTSKSVALRQQQAERPQALFPAFFDSPSCMFPCLLCHRCEQLLGQVSAELSHLNLYNVLEDCHHDTSKPAALRQQQAERLQALRQTHKAWPLTGAVQHGQRVHNWATLLGHNPPCTVSM